MAGRQCGEGAIFGLRDGAQPKAKSSDSKSGVPCTPRELVLFAEKKKKKDPPRIAPMSVLTSFSFTKEEQFVNADY